MSRGKLYKSNDEQFVAHVDYRLYDKSPTKLWGELTLVDYVRLDDGDGFIIELEDKRKSKCHLKKRVNVAVSGVPPRYVYHVTGLSPLEY